MGVYAGVTNSWINISPSNSLNGLVTSGLVLALDAGRTLSYVGSGTTWTDLSDKISTATGALPIYNTPDNGAVKGTGTRTDSLSSSLQLCIPCGAQSGLDLNDLSVTGRSSSLQTVTNNGVVNVTSTSKFYGGTGNFSGAATQWASVPNDGRYNLASRQYTTIEFWYRCDSTAGTKGILATGSYNSTGWEIYVNANGGCDLVGWNGTSDIIALNTGAATLGVWHHCAFVINYTAGTKTVTPYLDGVSNGSTSTTNAFPNGAANLFIGRRNTWPVTDSGTLYLQDIRVYSTIKYTANFIPPIPNNGTLTNGPTYSSANGGSIVFDGTNDYATAPLSSQFEFGTGEFTVEAWVNLASVSIVSSRILGIGDGANGGAPLTYTGWSFNVTNLSGTIYLYFYRFDGTETFYRVVIPSFSTNQWFHFVATRNASNTLTLYSNGVAISTTASVTQSYNSVNSQPLYLGAIFEGSGGASTKYLNGRISNARIYKGKALTEAEIQQNFNATRSRYGI